MNWPLKRQLQVNQMDNCNYSDECKLPKWTLCAFGNPDALQIERGRERERAAAGAAGSQWLVTHAISQKLERALNYVIISAGLIPRGARGPAQFAKPQTECTRRAAAAASLCWYAFAPRGNAVLVLLVIHSRLYCFCFFRFVAYSCDFYPDGCCDFVGWYIYIRQSLQIQSG